MTAQPLTSRQVAEALQIDKATVNRWARNGRLAPAQQVPGYNGARLFDPASIEALKQQEKAS